jgi:hypothetical protein
VKEVSVAGKVVLPSTAMPTFSLRQEIDCTPSRFWEIFFDNDLQSQLFADLGFPKWEVVDQKETESHIIRIVKAVPKLDAPAPVAKLLGSGFGYTEEGRFDKTSKVYTFVVTPTTLANKLKNEGTVRCEPKGDAKCIRIVDILVEAKILGLSGVIEKNMEKNTREGWEKSAAFFNARLKKEI